MPTMWESSAEPIPGYRLVERLGRGGFGEVWKAEAPGGLPKAIKFVHGEVASADGNHANQELKALERVRGVRHPFILSMERFDIIDGQLMIVMEIADCNLEQRLREYQAQGLAGIPRAELLGYLSEAAEALDVMSHDYDLQHLDIKPQNIFLIGGHVKVADFGLVKDLEGCTASVTGGVTPVYAPPETFDGWVSRSSDQYSLAIVYQELLTGKRPYAGPSARQFMMQHLTAEPDLSSLPVCDQAIVGRALIKDPKERFPTCREFVQSLRAAGKQTYSTTSLADEATETIPAAFDHEALSTQLVKRPGQGNADAAGKTIMRSPAVLDRQSLKSSTGGTLRPTLVIGLGDVGLSAVEVLGQKAHARFGDTPFGPIFRLVGVDVESALSRPEVQSLSREAMDQVFCCRLRKPNQYFQEWDDLKHLSSWMDPNLMFQMTSSGGTNGFRALGRLAFFENYRRLLSRLRSEVDALLDPEQIQELISARGMKLRSGDPRICIVTSMGDGTGSGMALDMCYLAKRVLLEAGVSSPDVDAYFISELRTGVAKQAELRRVNTFALSQEILDLTQPGVEFRADYEGNGDVFRATGTPFKAAYYFDVESTVVPDPKLSAMLDLVGNLIVESSTSIIGKRLDHEERQGSWPIHRSMGSFSLVSPIRPLIDTTAARLCRDVVDHWLETMPKREGEQVTQSAVRLIGASGFDPNDIADSLLSRCDESLPQPIHVMVAETINEVEEQLRETTSKEHPEIYRAALEALRELLGPDPDNETEIIATPFESALEAATNELAVELLKPLFDACSSTLDQPGMRLERARRTWEGFASYLLQKLDQTQESLRTEIQKVCRRSRQLRERIGSGIHHISDTPAKRLEWIQEYAQEKIGCRLREQVIQVYLVLRGRLSDWSRELVGIRQTVERLRSRLDERSKADAAIGNSWATQTIYPGGMLDLESAVEHLHGQVRAAAEQDIDRWIQTTTLRSLGGFWAVCHRDDEFAQGLPKTLIRSAGQWLQEGLADTDVAQSFFDRHGEQADGLIQEIRSFLEWSVPTVRYRPPTSGIDPAPATNFAMVTLPKTAASEALAQNLKAFVSGTAPEITLEGEDCIFLQVESHESLARMLPKWVLEAKPLYEAARATRLSPEVLPQAVTAS